MLTSICVYQFWTLICILLSLILILMVTKPEVNDKSDSEIDQETFESDIKIGHYQDRKSCTGKK